MRELTQLPVLFHGGLPAAEGVLVDLLLHLLWRVCHKDGAGWITRAHLACFPLQAKLPPASSGVAVSS